MCGSLEPMFSCSKYILYRFGSHKTNKFRPAITLTGRFHQKESRTLLILLVSNLMGKAGGIKSEVATGEHH